jgi:hypothetical protein
VTNLSGIFYQDRTLTKAILQTEKNTLPQYLNSGLNGTDDLNTFELLI